MGGSSGYVPPKFRRERFVPFKTFIIIIQGAFVVKKMLAFWFQESAENFSAFESEVISKM